MLRFIDLFAGMGGTRIGFEQSLDVNDIPHKCVFTSEIKPHAIEAYKANFPNEPIHGDITKIDPANIPDFDYLLAGFPCQPFSSAGTRDGLQDSRGGLFFNLFEILEIKQPQGFLLENVDGLVTINDGKTLEMMLKLLRNAGYKTAYAILNAIDFGVPQGRSRLYIIGDKDQTPFFHSHTPETKTAGSLIDYNADIPACSFCKLLSKKFSRSDLEGKSIKDKRGGDNNIHSWDLAMKGKVNARQSKLLGRILTSRRYKKWAAAKGIPWMDGMPLTYDEIKTFIDYPKLQHDLEYLTNCGYLKFEHPKTIRKVDGRKRRVYKTSAEKGYNIVTGKLSFPLTKILDPNGFVPTIVATETGKIAVATDKGVRRITVPEGLAFSGFPLGYDLEMLEYNEAFDLIGNTVMPPVIKYVSSSLLGLHFDCHSTVQQTA
jgi:DNA (cytosine-5)-methyltransferase 1